MRDKKLLEDCVMILTDWIHYYAPEMCEREDVIATIQRAWDNGGWLAYTAEILERLDEERRHAKKT